MTQGVSASNAAIPISPLSLVSKVYNLRISNGTYICDIAAVQGTSTSDATLFMSLLSLVSACNFVYRTART